MPPFSISRILLPVDFSDRCLGMLRYAKAIAAQYGAELILLHVANPIYEVPPTGLSGPVYIPVSQKNIARQGDDLELFAADQLTGINVRRVLYEGDPVEQIVGFAKSENVDLIAMPTHGYGVFRQFLIGSVTAKILHDVDCAVLTGVHMQEQPSTECAGFSQILAAIDLDTPGSGVLQWASQLAARFHSQLGIVHAAPSVSSARQDVETLMRAAGIADAAIHIPEGETAAAVCSVAKETGADLLVIGRGPQEATGGRLTTQAYSIVRQSPCPVISITGMKGE